MSKKGTSNDGNEGLAPTHAGKKPRVTQKRKLHSSNPYWPNTQQSSVVAGASPSRRHYDVIVVGGGISGALAAQTLAEKGQRVLIVDKAQAVRGSTAASTAMIQHEIDVPLHQLGTMIGPAKAARAWRRSVRAVNDLAARDRLRFSTEEDTVRFR